MQRFERIADWLVESGYHNGAEKTRKFADELLAAGDMPDDHVYHHPDFDFDPVRYLVSANGSTINLAYKEYLFLYALVYKPNTPVTKEEMAQYIWEDPQNMPNSPLKAMNVLVHRVRKKIYGNDPKGSKVIKTIKEVGYMLVDEPQPQVEVYKPSLMDKKVEAEEGMGLKFHSWLFGDKND